jgi:hypothetical protein
MSRRLRSKLSRWKLLQKAAAALQRALVADGDPRQHDRLRSIRAEILELMLDRTPEHRPMSAGALAIAARQVREQIATAIGEQSRGGKRASGG